jgi:diadenosine tetraphosphate (Ap4A) HIT family hydrolase
MSDNEFCPFCHPDPKRILAENDICFIYQDGFPVSSGHALLIPKRHVATLFECSAEDQAILLATLNQAKRLIDQSHQPDGYNIGINQAPAGGQTVPHLHIHLIPRYQGDAEDPRGGVRWVLPEKAKYW